MSFLVSKSDGVTENFDKSKLLRSLKRAGAEEANARTIVQTIEDEQQAGSVITTHEIYAKAFAQLRSSKRPAAARYSLKRAVLDLGPSGFPFESFLAHIFEAHGFHTKTDQIIKGACTEHEVDIVLTKGEELIFVEAKFHNSPGFKSDLKVALYVKARIDDLLAAGHPNAKGLLVTNTKFTERAVEYAQCQLLDLLSWDYPQGSTLHEKIEEAKAFPVTVLTTLSRREKTALLEAKIVLCSQIINQPQILSTIGVFGHKAESVLEEAGVLCSSSGVL